MHGDDASVVFVLAYIDQIVFDHNAVLSLVKLMMLNPVENRRYHIIQIHQNHVSN